MNTPLLDGIRKIAAKDSFKEKYGITETEKIPGWSVASIGFSPKSNKWYGWSHRAIGGFTIGSKVKRGDCGFLPANKDEFLADLQGFWGKKGHEYIVKPDGVDVKKTNKDSLSHFEPYPSKWGRGEWTAKTMADAKQMAIDFSESVS